MSAVNPLPSATRLDCTRFARGLFIGGRWLPGADIAVVDPSTEEVLAKVADAGVDDGQPTSASAIADLRGPDEFDNRSPIVRPHASPGLEPRLPHVGSHLHRSPTPFRFGL